MPGSIANVPLDSIAHVIQVALTPVFLLSGIGALLNVFNTRLARVSEHVSHTEDLLAADPQGEDAPLMRRHIRRLRYRVLTLDIAIVLAALDGASTCGAAFTLFVGAVRDAEANRGSLAGSRQAVVAPLHRLPAGAAAYGSQSDHAVPLR